MVFTFNIANGLTAGLDHENLGGRARSLRPATIVLTLLCALHYVFGIPH